MPSGNKMVLPPAHRAEARRLYTEESWSAKQLSQKYGQSVEYFQGIANRGRWGFVRNELKRYNITLEEFDRRQLELTTNLVKLENLHQRALWSQLVRVYLGMPRRDDRLQKSLRSLIASGKMNALDIDKLTDWAQRGVVYPGRPEFAQPLVDLAMQVERGDITLPEAGLRHAPGALMVKLLRGLESEVIQHSDLRELLLKDPAEFTNVLAEVRRLCETAGKLMSSYDPLNLDSLTKDQAGELLASIIERHPDLGLQMAESVNSARRR